MRRATVLIPTHNHGRLLLAAVRSVLRQTVQDFEIFIIGDGITEETREAVTEALAMDGRVRFFDHPKTPRTGEPYRHLALRDATGAVVCYLSDDDLWLPNHLEVFCRALEHADVVHSLPCWIDAEGALCSSLIDWAVPEWLQWTLDGQNKVCLSTAGHTMEFYHRLPHGWQTTPTGRYTDHFMWEQMLAMPGVRAACTGHTTVINFPTPLRRDWTLKRREEELIAWENRIAERPGELLDETRRALARAYYHCEIGQNSLIQHLQRLQTENERRSQTEQNRTAEMAGEIDRLSRHLEMWEKRREALPGFLRNLLRWHWRKKGLW